MIYHAAVERNREDEQPSAPRCSECGAEPWRWAAAMDYSGTFCRHHFMRERELDGRVRVDVDELASLLGDELTARVIAISEHR